MSLRINHFYTISILLHALVFLALYYYTPSANNPQAEYIEIGFGFGEGAGGGDFNPFYPEPGGGENSAEKSEETVNPELTEKVSSADATEQASKNKSSSRENPSDGTGEGFGDGYGIGGGGGGGYDIDWGGGGRRKIYNYNLPEYPGGVSKNIDIRLRFSILPDGSVGTIIPLTKADTRLENSAMNSLRRWRFEPLPQGFIQREQFAVIVFPYRVQ